MEILSLANIRNLFILWPLKAKYLAAAALDISSEDDFNMKFKHSKADKMFTVRQCWCESVDGTTYSNGEEQ